MMNEQETHIHLSKATLVAYSPVVFFLVLLVGVVIHMHIPTPFISSVAGWVIGVVFLMISPAITIRALRVRHSLYVPVVERTCTSFDVGPYRKSRHPVYVGFLMMIIGFGFVINSLIMLLLALALFIFFSVFIIPEEERELEKHCPEVYQEYKKRVRMWL